MERWKITGCLLAGGAVAAFSFGGAPGAFGPTPAFGAPDPAHDIALVGVTRIGSQSTAWLVDLSSGERETASPGGSAFGFTVAKVGPESVVLSRLGERVVLRLGEKRVPGKAVAASHLTVPRAPVRLPTL